MSARLIESKEIKGISLYKERPSFSRLDIVPFSGAYVLLGLYFPYYLAKQIFSEQDDNSFYLALFLFLAVFVANVLVFLCTHWFIGFNCYVKCTKVSKLSEATLVKVDPAPNKGKMELCNIQKDENGIFFNFQKLKFCYNEDKKRFEQTAYPVHESFGFYADAQGHTTAKELEAAKLKWGPNKFEIPFPTFGELYKEQALAPFFVFQVFCVLLWCLDEYWYYSLFTLAMLLMFEATVVKSRLKNLASLRSMGMPSQPISVYRQGKWSTIDSYSLLPGDICSISSDKNSQKDMVCPCDMVLLAGTCVVNEAMLTGESTPRLKESIADQARDNTFSIKNAGVHTLFGGTKIIQHSPDKSHRIVAPDGGCITYVLRTGFSTSQGKLMRMILFSTERITANTKESFMFIGFLLIFALMASGYVLKKGLEDAERSRYKLVLNCTLIITSVVPPELPMELSLAVNNSLMALYRLGIFCTEPFRIPFAGKLDICCFDKTGTLTSDDIICKGIVEAPKENEKEFSLIPAADASPNTAFVVAGCHSLMHNDNKLVGDPLETASLSALNWSFNKEDTAASKKSGERYAVRIVHRYHFTSALKRMSCIVSLSHEKDPVYWLVTKGAPEKIKQLLVPEKVPSNYDEAYRKYTALGCRVLALAHKPIETQTTDKLKRTVREDVEKDLEFAGFIVFECPLKEGSLQAIEAIQNSSHKVCMITGDNTLTACHVASQLKITSKPVVILSEEESSKKNANNNNSTAEFSWKTIDEKTTIKSETSLSEVLKSYDLCISGGSIPFFIENPAWRKLLPEVKVFSRVAPDQKETILSLLKGLGYTTLMCGDGTNDVGALKQAHVGVALLNNAPAPAPVPRTNQQGAKPAQTKTTTTATSGQRKTGSANQTASSPATTPTTFKQIRDMTPEERRAHVMKQLKDAEMESEVPMLQLGDASIASPFTSRHSSVMSVVHIIRQGRCTLVTTTQMFKILALNCLISAYSLSVLYLDGIKYGDVQATTTGMLIAFCFLFISRSRPLEKLSKQRPEAHVFTPYMITSILGQFALHLYCLISVVDKATELQGGEKASPDKDFAPNLVNSAVFLISSAMQVATFVVNYKGHPFMENLMENKPLRIALSIAGGFTFFMAAEISSDFNEYFELVPFSSEFRNFLLFMITLDYAGSWLIENVASRLLQRS